MGRTCSDTKESIGSEASSSALTSFRGEIDRVPAARASKASAELMKASSSHASPGFDEPGLSTLAVPPDMETKSCPLMPAPGLTAGIFAYPTAVSRSVIGAVPTPSAGLITERQK